MRHFYADQAESRPSDAGARIGQYLTGAYRFDGIIWRVISIPKLLADPRFAGGSG